MENELSYDPAIPLLGISPEKTITQKDTCTPRFSAALFAIARTWKQRKRSSADVWIRKMWCIDTKEYCAAPKRVEPGHLQWCPAKRSESDKNN